MDLDTKAVRACLKDGDFKRLFIEELGWDINRNPALEVEAGDAPFQLVPLAVKRGVQVFECPATGRELVIPERGVRQKIEREVTKLAREHVVVFTNADRTEQIWQWADREPGRAVALKEQRYASHQSGEALVQKLQHIRIALDEEASMSLTGVIQRLKDAFPRDKVTKKFYERFKTEHGNFLNLISGIPDPGDREWYASLMLNRLMFVYFIEKKGFLDGDPNYLRNRLARMQRKRKDKFHTFYRHFLMRLFHEGLGSQARSAELDELLGEVPYLNGGLFDVHDLEKENAKIEIPDRAFEALFDFFDSYEWHLDDRPLEKGNEINPDVLGYIFEKYVNQKQMGAYYTKEDITEYISKNTVIPYVFDAAEKDCAIAFRKDSAMWRLLREDPDRYIYDAVRKGVDERLPRDIAAGIKDVSKRGGWNRPAGPEFALPTETWREHVARRQRCLDLRAKLRGGKVHTINDLITYNLNIRQFAQDAIEQAEGPELVRAFFEAIENITILDPAVGSGAFLFAALNILQPLYDACLDRMQAFIEDAKERGDDDPRYFVDFRKILERVNQHPNREYYVLKSIVIKNLYGVDIMEEAVEICKLRLFLKLVAQLERPEEIEPLPDMDFNIRAGNTLVGFTSLEGVRQAMTIGAKGQGRMITPEQKAELELIEKNAAVADELFQAYHVMQAGDGHDEKAVAKAKENLRGWLDQLRNQLDRHLASEYDVEARNAVTYEAWRMSHQPFHWFVEFYGIMRNGGFAVAIGNPPYVEDSAQEHYLLRGYRTEGCGNLFAYMWERSLHVTIFNGRAGLIIPVASVCTDRYTALQGLWNETGTIHASNFNDRPSKLFEGLEHNRLSIVLVSKGLRPGQCHASGYNKWHASERATLFQRLEFVEASGFNVSGAIAKVGTPIELGILRKFASVPVQLSEVESPSGQETIFYTRKISTFLQVLDFIPEMRDSSGALREPTELKKITFNDRRTRDLFLALLNSTLFYWVMTVYSDCRNLNRREIDDARYDPENAADDEVSQLGQLSRKLMKDIRANSRILPLNYKKHGTMSVQATYPRFSKGIIDAIDMALAPHYELTDHELDFITNWDIKYRMGADGSEDDGEHA